MDLLLYFSFCLSLFLSFFFLLFLSFFLSLFLSFFFSVSISFLLSFYLFFFLSSILSFLFFLFPPSAHFASSFQNWYPFLLLSVFHSFINQVSSLFISFFPTALLLEEVSYRKTENNGCPKT